MAQAWAVTEAPPIPPTSPQARDALEGIHFGIRLKGFIVCALCPSRAGQPLWSVVQPCLPWSAHL